MKILVVEVGKYPYEKEIDGSLKSMQRIVGGRIQSLYPFSDKVGIVCNDEGILLGMPFNRKICNECCIMGTFFVCGLGKENFVSLSDDLMKKYEKLFREPQIITSNGIINISPKFYEIIKSLF